MTFYQELQLSSAGSKQLIKNTQDSKEKRRQILHIICPLKKRSVDEVTVLAIRIAEQFGGRLMFWDCPLAPQSLK